MHICKRYMHFFGYWTACRLLGNGQWNISIIKIGCFYPVSIIGLSSAHLRLISKTEMGSKKRPIIKIPLCYKDTKNMENVTNTCVCAFFFVPLHAIFVNRFTITLMGKEILIVIGIIAACVALLCVRIILQKNGKFSSEHISQNKRMREDGIHCATSQDRETRKKAQKKLQVNQL